MPIGWLVLLWGYIILDKGLAYLIKNRLYVSGLGVLLCLGMTLSSYQRSGWELEYEFSEAREYEEWAQQYKDCSAVYIYDKASNDTVLNHCRVLAEYKEYSFVEETRVAGYIRQYENNPIILYIDSGNNNNQIINDILNMNTFNEVKLVYSYRGADIYCIS